MPLSGKNVAETSRAQCGWRFADGEVNRYGGKMHRVSVKPCRLNYRFRFHSKKNEKAL